MLVCLIYWFVDLLICLISWFVVYWLVVIDHYNFVILLICCFVDLLIWWSLICWSVVIDDYWLLFCLTCWSLIGWSLIDVLLICWFDNVVLMDLQSIGCCSKIVFRSLMLSEVFILHLPHNILHYSYDISHRPQKMDSNLLFVDFSLPHSFRTNGGPILNENFPHFDSFEWWM